MNPEATVRKGKATALVTFLGGTLIMLAYYYSSASHWLLVGFAYVVLAALVNAYTLMRMWFALRSVSTHRKQVWLTGLLMFLNIPVFLFYCWFTMILLNTMRITFVNSSRTVMTNIEISGCDSAHITELQPGESETVWIAIAYDCELNMDYLRSGKQRRLNVAGYLTTGMGRSIQFNIEGENPEKL
jgi:hypothetical protein